LLESISEGDVVIDAGANIGCFTLLAARKVGARGLVIAIEPGPNNYKRLKSNIEINGFKNDILVREALDRDSKDSRLFREGGWMDSSMRTAVFQSELLQWANYSKGNQ